jgi:hypothetical protein
MLGNQPYAIQVLPVFSSTKKSAWVRGIRSHWPPPQLPAAKSTLAGVCSFSGDGHSGPGPIGAGSSGSMSVAKGPSASLPCAT